MKSVKLEKLLFLPITWLGAIVLAIFWLGIWYQVQGEFDAARKTANQDLTNYSRVFDEHIIRTIRELDKALLIARKLYLKTRQSMPYDEAVSQRLPDPTLLSDISFQLAMIDRNGILRGTTIGAHPPEPINLADREHFKVHEAGRDDTLFISKPVLGRRSGRWSVQLTRRIDGPDGTFEGVLVASMDPDYFGRFYGAIDIGGQGAVILAGLDGVVRVASGAQNVKLGDNISATDLVRAASSGGGIYTGDMDGSGIERIFAVRRLAEFPLFVAVGISSNEIYASARHNRQRYLAVGACISALILFVVIASMRHHFTIDRMARYDDLTGLPNRILFRERLEAGLSDLPRGSFFALMLVDVDKFKSANDMFGHAFGDKLLREAARRLKKTLRSSDTVARLGGDEFAVIIVGLGSPEQVIFRVGDILDEIRRPLVIDGQQVSLTCSIGSAITADRNISIEELLKNADLALYEAKSRGRNRHVPFQPEMAERFTERRKLEENLRAALEANQLQLHYQPIRALEGNLVCGFEALLRWHDPEKGWISPSTFIPIAEESGLIISLGEWALREACAQANRFVPGKRVSVNLSPVQFRDPSLVEKIRNALAISGLDPEYLELEITESLMMEANQSTIETIEQIRAHGIKIAIDDFGVGYSSLGYLPNFEFDKIKIDRSFIKDLGQNSKSRAIIKAIADLGKSLNLVTTAEGVETLIQLELLRGIGCDEVQGFLIGPAQPIEMLAEFLRSDEEQYENRSAVGS
jgi:diguanylate cyclase (GGDEF)-like protein